MCYRPTGVILLTVYFAVSGWKLLPEAAGRHDGLEEGFEKSVDLSAHESPVVRNCDALANALNRLNVDHSGSQLPSHKTFVSDLEICNNQKKTCCTRDVEEKLHTAAIETTHVALQSATSYLSQFLSDNHLHYQDQFIGMLRVAENDTEEVLKSIYKIDHKDWKGCLNDLFLDLSTYLRQKDGDVTESLTKFYNQLFPVIFQFVLNDPSVVDLDLNYRECLMEARQDLTPQPFGDIPTKLAHSLTESLRAARIFLSTLAFGSELMNVTALFPFEQQCSHALTRLEYCSLCDGLTGARSCRALCQNIMRGCLSGIVGLERRWDSVINQLQLLGSSMRGSRDLEEVLESFHTRVSESIMHSMETTHKYYEKILSTCGHPKTFQSHNFSELSQPSRRRLPSFPQRMHNHQPKLHSKIEMMLRNVIASKGFLSKLPDAMCNSERFPLEGCWNGTAMGLYKRHVPANVLAAQVADNPEMKVHLSANIVFSTLQKKLDHIQKLLSSVVGDDEEQMQSDVGYFEGSGARRYSSNGDDDGDDDGLSDDEDINVDESGSGSDDDDNPRFGVKTRRPHQHPNREEEDDIDFEKSTRKTVPYITKSHHQPRPPGSGARSQSFTVINIVSFASLILPLLAIRLS